MSRAKSSSSALVEESVLQDPRVKHSITFQEMIHRQAYSKEQIDKLERKYHNEILTIQEMLKPKRPSTEELAMELADADGDLEVVCMKYVKGDMGFSEVQRKGKVCFFDGLGTCFLIFFPLCAVPKIFEPPQGKTHKSITFLVVCALLRQRSPILRVTTRLLRSRLPRQPLDHLIKDPESNPGVVVNEVVDQIA